MTANLVELLMRCGFIRIRAIVLAELIKVGKCTARELERMCDLRQPEVSLVMSYLLEKKWISVSKQESSTQGRPVQLYQLIPVEQLYQELLTEKQGELKAMQETLTELKTAMIPIKTVSVESATKTAQQQIHL